MADEPQVGAITLHWTYQEPAPSSLQQGDILIKTPEMSNILQKVHPHYHEEASYTHFMVITQTCDLIRRGSPTPKCGSRYITLAAVRPMSMVLERELIKHQDEFCQKAGVCSQDEKRQLKQLVERLLNNNDQEHFYLHPQPEKGLTNPSCVFLRLSIALRAYQHYEACMAARILTLEENFKARLGWQVGYIYSRVGTEDWTDHVVKPQFQKMVDDWVDGLCKWFPKRQLELAVQSLPKQSQGPETREALREFLDKVTVRSNREIVLASVITVMRKMNLIVTREQELEIRTRLQSESDFNRATKG